MNAESVVSIIKGEDSNSIWNDSEEEQEDYFEVPKMVKKTMAMMMEKMTVTDGDDDEKMTATMMERVIEKW